MIFRNEHGGEYLFYYVTFKAVAPGVMATIDLATPIRKSTSHVVTLHNPLSTPVTFNSQCSVADIQLPPSFTVPPLSEVCISVHVDVLLVSKDVFERCTSNRKWTFFVLNQWFAQIFGQIVSRRVKALSKTSLVTSRYFTMKKTLLPVDARHSKWPLLSTDTCDRPGIADGRLTYKTL